MVDYCEVGDAFETGHETGSEIAAVIGTFDVHAASAGTPCMTPQLAHDASQVHAMNTYEAGYP